MMSIEEKIRVTKLELESVRRARWQDEKDFYERSEEMRCGISLLRSQMEDKLSRGVDVTVFKNIMEETNDNDDFPSMSIHFGHQMLLLSIVHQMEMRNSLLKLAAAQAKSMVLFFERTKSRIEEENAVLATDQINTVTSFDEYIVDDALAQKVVAQRLVIRKLQGMLPQEDFSSGGISMPTLANVPLNEPVFGGKIENAFENFFEASPRNVRNLVPLLDKIENSKLAMRSICDVSPPVSKRGWWGVFRR
jgi:hypothetical protein